MFKNNKDKNSLPINIDQINSEVVKSFLVENFRLTNGLENQEQQILVTPLEKELKVLIDVIDLKKEFSKMKVTKKVLNGITFQVREGEAIGILGANGAGKTTLVEILAGLNKQTSGEVKYLYDYRKNYLEEIGIQFQDSSYPPGLLVKELIVFVIEIYKIEIDNNELYALITIFGISEYYHKHASSLSGGQQQRLNALLALMHKPKILFLDEISTGLDITIRTKIKNFIKLYAKENNMTLVLVSHDMDEVEFLADRILIIDKGNVIVNIAKDEVLQKYKSLTEFVEPYINK